MVLSSASVIGCGLWAVIYWLTGSFGLGVNALLGQKPTVEALGNLAFALSGRTDGYLLVFFSLRRSLHMEAGPGRAISATLHRYLPA